MTFLLTLVRHLPIEISKFLQKSGFSIFKFLEIAIPEKIYTKAISDSEMIYKNI